MEILVVDNGGETLDRYTAIDHDVLDTESDSDMVECLGFSDNPTHPLGFSQFSECSKSWVFSSNNESIPFTSLSEELQAHVLNRLT